MKRILIVSQSMEIGGVERSLLGLLEALEKYEVHVDLFLMKHGGAFQKYIPSYVNVLPEDEVCASLTTPGIDTLKRRQFHILMKRICAKYKARKYAREHQLGENIVYLSYVYEALFNEFPSLGMDQPYDLAISYLGPHNYVAYRIAARTKVAWLHTDYSSLGMDVDLEQKTYSHFDRIIGVSEDVSNQFAIKFPRFENRLMTIENILPKAMIEKWVNENRTTGFDPGIVNLLSIGRFCYQKNFENIPQICSILRSKGLHFQWYLIGYGSLEDTILENIKKYNVEDCLTVLGKITNPYPYIADCDLYIQPSRYEGCAVAVREAQFFGKPVVITNYKTSKDQVKHNVDGFVFPLENDDLAEGIANIIQNIDNIGYIKTYCLNHDYTNTSCIKEILSLLP